MAALDESRSITPQAPSSTASQAPPSPSPSPFALPPPISLLDAPHSITTLAPPVHSPSTLTLPPPETSLAPRWRPLSPLALPPPALPIPTNPFAATATHVYASPDELIPCTIERIETWRRDPISASSETTTSSHDRLPTSINTRERIEAWRAGLTSTSSEMTDSPRRSPATLPNTQPDSGGNTIPPEVYREVMRRRELIWHLEYLSRMKISDEASVEAIQMVVDNEIKRAQRIHDASLPLPLPAQPQHKGFLNWVDRSLLSVPAPSFSPLFPLRLALCLLLRALLVLFLVLFLFVWWLVTPSLVTPPPASGNAQGRPRTERNGAGARRGVEGSAGDRRRGAGGNGAGRR
ncbi:hypothetical protein QBC41DRAFT_351661 [Cercophora samala]|uniref:Uncharacterized protein n=1 Tax=Cercophora samala TaxID=330535 RepID=A0AA40CRI0_9PEZI|nr:hypothetical protein QBC41DRAFT_351661 [Cercophora samala]